MASNIISWKAFVDKYPDVKLDRSLTDPTVPSAVKSAGLLDRHLLVDWLSGDLGSQLKLVQDIIHFGQEKYRCFLVYEVLKSFAEYSQGSLLLQLREQVDELADSDDFGLISQGQTINFERQTADAHGMAAIIEIVVVTREDPDHILLTVKVKQNIIREADMWQTLAELMNASIHKGGRSCASLTDAFSWKFLEAKRTGKDWLVSASQSFAMFNADLNGVYTTNHVFSLLHSCLFPGKEFPSQSQLHDVNEKAENAMTRKASVLVAGLRNESAAAAEIVKLSAERIKKDQRIADSDKRIADLERQLHEVNRVRTS